MPDAAAHDRSRFPFWFQIAPRYRPNQPSQPHCSPPPNLANRPRPQATPDKAIPLRSLCSLLRSHSSTAWPQPHASSPS
ncbi:hypothetical protein BU26DRAFT_518494 [Trematosphaeria pertusa]|uniref:Uncharacterized protein n=1 Tax=Trematosphaeria pertusa TaxID=390896 RepID=A0A6A6IIJ8_9PLEO|nr:uncharacterized protein BU26DRAFT_518494 [Trematosphaeria pertusa]KAF2250029.1 hypothetical protein BU26DRAFT_518494 [Trematosphaeria pertusa]